MISFKERERKKNTVQLWVFANRLDRACMQYAISARGRTTEVEAMISERKQKQQKKKTQISEDFTKKCKNFHTKTSTNPEKTSLLRCLSFGGHST